MVAKREVRLRQVQVGGVGRSAVYEHFPIVRLGTVGAWSMVRRADFPHAAPFVISNKEWDRLAVQGTDQ